MLGINTLTVLPQTTNGPTGEADICLIDCKVFVVHHDQHDGWLGRRRIRPGRIWIRVTAVDEHGHDVFSLLGLSQCASFSEPTTLSMNASSILPAISTSSYHFQMANLTKRRSFASRVRFEHSALGVVHRWPTPYDSYNSASCSSLSSLVPPTDLYDGLQFCFALLVKTRLTPTSTPHNLSTSTMSQSIPRSGMTSPIATRAIVMSRNNIKLDKSILRLLTAMPLSASR